MMSGLHAADLQRERQYGIDLVLLRIGSTPRTFLRTRSTVRALVPARCSTGPPRTVSSPAKGGVMSSEQNRGLSHALVDGGLNKQNLRLINHHYASVATA